jgi:hypothetical protein
MQAIIDRIGFRDSFDQFLTFLRRDPRFYAKTPEELLMRAPYIAKRTNDKLPALFGRLLRPAVHATLATVFLGVHSAALPLPRPIWRRRRAGLQHGKIFLEQDVPPTAREIDEL